MNASDRRRMASGVGQANGQNGQSRHVHRVNQTADVDGNTIRETCYCGVRRYVTNGSKASGWFYMERRHPDLAPKPGAQVVRLHRQMMVAALAFGQLITRKEATSQITKAAERLEQTAARWAIALGRVGRAARAR